MISHIGYPPELVDNLKLEELHRGLNIKPNEHFKNQHRASVFNAGQGFKKLREPVDKMDWRLQASAATVEAWYRPSHLAMTIPAAVLQLVSSDLPMFINYAGLGYIIGHEITHGFDNYGREIDWEGNLEDWWDAESEAK